MKRISNGESLVMEALWRKSPLSAEEVVADLAAENDWSQATVKTFINRLLMKKAIKAERDGRRYLYRPAMRRADFITTESQGLLDRLFDGRLAPLVAHFSQNNKLSSEDIAALKRLVKELDHGK
jgi:BlaI family transcriptional regulator, penicillinase repressor